MKIVDLFAGLEGWSASARDHHSVVSTDVDPAFETDVTADVLERDLADRLLERLGGRPDLVLASPPCESFSVLTIGRNWTRSHEPKTDAARLAVRLVERTLELIDELEPTFFVIENPRAKLRRLPVVADLERRTVTYCQLGEPFMKPTDLWGGFPPSLVLPPPCQTWRGRIEEDEDGISWVFNADGEPCHVSAPRGSRTGIQGEGVLFEEFEPESGSGLSRIRSRPTRGGLSAQKDVTHRVLGGVDGPTKFRGGMLSGMTEVSSRSPERHRLAALRAKVPEKLSRLVVEAVDRDLLDGRVPDLGRLF